MNLDKLIDEFYFDDKEIIPILFNRNQKDTSFLYDILVGYDETDDLSDYLDQNSPHYSSLFQSSLLGHVAVIKNVDSIYLNFYINNKGIVFDFSLKDSLEILRSCLPLLAKQLMFHFYSRVSQRFDLSYHDFVALNLNEIKEEFKHDEEIVKMLRSRNFCNLLRLYKIRMENLS